MSAWALSPGKRKLGSEFKEGFRISCFPSLLFVIALINAVVGGVCCTYNTIDNLPVSRYTEMRKRKKKNKNKQNHRQEKSLQLNFDKWYLHSFLPWTDLYVTLLNLSRGISQYDFKFTWYLFSSSYFLWNDSVHLHLSKPIVTILQLKKKKNTLRL